MKSKVVEQEFNTCAMGKKNEHENKENIWDAIPD